MSINKPLFFKRTILIILVGLTLVVYAKDYKWHTTGRLWERMEDSGINSRAIWPAGYGFQDNGADFGHWIAVKNMTDRDGNQQAFYVAEGGAYAFDEDEYNMPVYVKRYKRSAPPVIMVDGEDRTETFQESDDDYVDPDLPSDEMIESKWHTGAGVTIIRRSYAWAEKNHQDYIILDYTLINTGEMDGDEDNGIEQQQTLQDLYFVLHSNLRIGQAGEDLYPVHLTARDDWAEYYGSEAGDSLKILYMFDGQSLKKGGEAYDPAPSDGRLLAPQYVGYGLLHADTSPQDRTHWAEQPHGAQWRFYADPPSHGNSATHQDMYEYASAHNYMRMANEDDPTDVPTKYIAMSVGPYQLAFGDTIHIVMVEAAGGISQALCQEVGAKWKAGEYSNAQKDAIASTGEDSLHQAVYNAQYSYDNGYVVPQAPPAPDLEVNSGPGQVELRWSDVSTVSDPVTGINDFSGYRIYRAEGTADQDFTMIYECGGNSGNPVQNEYIDQDVRRGFAYFYYVTAFDDGSQNNNGLNPGQSLESSPFANRTDLAVHPTRRSEQDSDKITVIPNPYNLNSVNLFAGEKNKVLFVNLPPVCTIRIFTLSGDLVRTIEHTDNTGDEPWDLVTSSNQLVSSGLYIYHVEGVNSSGDKLESVIGKFSIVR